MSFIAQQRPQAQSDEPSRTITSARTHHHDTSGLSSEAQESGGGYVIVGGKDGAACRQMTEPEARQLQVDEPRTALRVISENRLNSQQQQGLKITLRGTSQLDQFPAAKAAFLRAAAKWESIIQSPITVVLDVDFGPTIFGTPFPSPNIIGATDPQRLLGTNEFNTLRNALIARASSTRQAEIFNALPQGSLPTDLGSTPNINTASSVLRALGRINAVADPTAEQAQFGFPPSMGFNSAFNFDFDPSDGIDSDKTDFEGVAIHELGHALGFVSGVGSKELTPSSTLAPSVWDFFRFRPAASGSFGGSPRIQLAGGEHIYFAGDAELPLSTSTSTGTGGGDGQQASHWKDNGFIGTYTGVMDPTAARSERLTITAADLTALSFFGYQINANSEVTEVLSVDDNSREEGLPLTNAIVVNRYAPARFPATLQAVRLQLPPTTDGSSPVDQPLRLVAFVDQNRTGQPPANPTLILDRMVNVPALPNSRIIEVVLTNPPVVNSGDLYVGIQSSSASVLIAGDRNGRQQNRSFVSTNNGASFQPLLNSSNTPVNFMSRIVLTETFGTTTSPALELLSPNATTPGGQAFTLVVQGRNFQSNSVVHWNGAERQTNLINGTRLQAQITAADVASAGTAQVTVLTPGSVASGALTFTINANRPVPTITRITPELSSVGGSSPLNFSVFGVNFTPQSVIRYNGADRATTVVDSTQLNTTLQPADFAAVAEHRITVFTPGPGGGASNEVSFTVISCGQQLSVLSHTIPSAGITTTGTTLTTPAPCTWSAVSNAPWITVTNPTAGSGAGKFVINYRVDPNAGADVRTGTLTIAGQTVNVRQLGRATSVSAAGFSAPLAANAIGAIFGGGLAKSTVSATSQPLPTNLNGTTVTVIDATGTSRSAPLFFVSAGQINFLVPQGTANGTATVRVLVDGAFVADGSAAISTIAPNLFSANASGKGLAAAVLLRVKADGTQIFEPVVRFDTATSAFVPVPIDFGAQTDRLFLLLYGSGIRGRSALGAVSVSVGGTDTIVSYAGPQNDFAGLDQINAELSRSLTGRGEVTINCTVDNRMTNELTVTIK